MRMTGIQLQQSTRGRWQGDVPALVEGVCTDSRTLHAGEAFLALRGPHFDGHTFGQSAAEQGAVALIGDRSGLQAWERISLPQLEVEDTLRALGDIASTWRGQLQLPVVAITGSYGKTTVRSMLEHVFTALGNRVAATKRNDNNLIGVPQTLMAIEGSERVALVECGISVMGEMQRLADMVQPDVSVITGFTAAHGEGLGGLSGVVHEKARLLAATRPEGWCVLGAGVAEQLRSEGLYPDALVCLDMDDDAEDIVHWHMEGEALHLHLADEEVSLPLLLPASHWAADMALVATLACRLLQVDLEKVAHALACWQPVSGRMQPVAGVNGSRVLDDAYNANPASMGAALETLRRLPGRHFAVLGDMAELGDDAEAQHTGLNLSAIEHVVLVGPQMRSLSNRYEQAAWVPDAADAIRVALAWPLAKGDTVLVKGSRSMGLDAVVLALTEVADAL